jgi:very-long-chain (3R)-3-hydroxyacyl-CoA dehydratase
MSSKAQNTGRPKGNSHSADQTRPDQRSPPTISTGPPTFVKTYLIAYNILSAVGWGYLLVSVLVHIFNLDGKSDVYKVPNTTTPRLLSPFPSVVLQRAQTTYLRVGALTAFVQSFAILEVIHVILGWVRSPLPTTASQVASRLFLVWGITEPFLKAGHTIFTRHIYI